MYAIHALTHVASIVCSAFNATMQIAATLSGTIACRGAVLIDSRLGDLLASAMNVFKSIAALAPIVPISAAASVALSSAARLSTHLDAFSSDRPVTNDVRTDRGW